jgi:hypothetical protein
MPFPSHWFHSQPIPFDSNPVRAVPCRAVPVLLAQKAHVVSLFPVSVRRFLSCPVPIPMLQRKKRKEKKSEVKSKRSI